MNLYKWYKDKFQKYIVDQNWEVKEKMLGEGCD